MKVNNSNNLVIDIKNTIFTLDIKVRCSSEKAKKLILKRKYPIYRSVSSYNQ